MRRTLISLFLLSILISFSLVSAEPSSPPRGALVGTWEAWYKTYYDGEQFDVLTVAQSGQHLSGTYQGHDAFPQEGRWYYFVRVQELTMDEDGKVSITIGPRHFVAQRPKTVDEPRGTTNVIPDSFRLQGNLGSDGSLSLDCSSEAKVCPFEGTRVYKKRRN